MNHSTARIEARDDLIVGPDVPWCPTFDWVWVLLKYALTVGGELDVTFH